MMGPVEEDGQRGVLVQELKREEMKKSGDAGLVRIGVQGSYSRR